MASRLGERIGQRLRARREAQGLTQAELAERVGITDNYLSAVERGVKLPTLPTLDALATALDTQPVELLGTTRGDAWLDELVDVGSAVPKSLRPIALAVLRAITGARSHRG